MPKARYRIMRDYMPKGRLGLTDAAHLYRRPSDWPGGRHGEKFRQPRAPARRGGAVRQFTFVEGPLASSAIAACVTDTDPDGAHLAVRLEEGSG